LQKYLLLTLCRAEANILQKYSIQ